MNWYELEFETNNNQKGFAGNHLVIEAESIDESLEVYKNNIGSLYLNGEIINTRKVDYIYDVNKNEHWFEFTIHNSERPGHWEDRHIVLSAWSIDEALKIFRDTNHTGTDLTKIKQVGYVFPVERREGYKK